MSDGPSQASRERPVPAAQLARPAGARDASAPTSHPLAALHTLLGNQAIQRAALDPPIAAPESEHEREAERVADLVTSGTPPPLSIGPAPTSIGRAPEDDERRRRPEPSRPAPATATAPPPRPAAPPVAAQTPKPEPGKPPPGRKLDAPAPANAQATAPKEAKPLPEKRKEDQQLAMAREPSAPAAPQVTPTVAEGLSGSAGGGRPLPAASRSYFEPRLGHDLSGVRVHDDATAARAASDLSARAFAYGQDVYFGAGRYQPDTADGRRLLAHELVHTVQQQPGAARHRKAIQRAPDPPPAQGTTTAATPAAAGAAGTAPVDARTLGLAVGQLEGEGADRIIHFADIGIPSFKLGADHRSALYTAKKPLRQAKNYTRGETDQRRKWADEVAAGPPVQNALSAKAPTPPAAQGAPGGPAPPYVFKAPTEFGTTPPRYFIGDLPTVAKAMNLPSWDRAGRPHAFQVDHVVELQLAGWNGTGPEWANSLDNYELLDARKNLQSGPIIQGLINDRVEGFLTAARGDRTIPRSAGTLKRRFPLQFDQAIVSTAHSIDVGDNEFWRKEHIIAGDHINNAVQVASATEIGSADEVKVFPEQTGGVAFTFAWSGSTEPRGRERNDYLSPFTVTEKSFPGAGQPATPVLGTLTFGIPGANRKWMRQEASEVDVKRIGSLPFAGYVEKQPIRDALYRLRKKGASPVQIDAEPGLLPQGGVGVRGRIMPEIPALEGVGIDFELAGDDLRVFKEFSIDDVKVPRPFVINDVTLIASAGTESGLQLTGQVDFAIERVGQGLLRATAGTERGIEFDGEFNFQSTLFDPARISIAYREGAWSGAGDLGIPPGKVPGIRRGLFHVGYAEGRLDATGTAETTIPGVSQAAVALSYSEADGLAIGGELTLAPTVPGLRGGRLQARVQQRPDSEEYHVTAHGEAQPAIPGVDATLTIDYDDGALTVQGAAAYARGPVSGHLTLGATNRPVDPEGNIVPTGAPTERVTAYGGGQATIRLTPWLQGTAGLRILPNGQIELSGAIALPATVDVFDEKSYNRNILTIGLDIPIVGVAVAGQRIGIFATIQGGLDFSAGVGPGQLQELGVSVTFNPDQPEQTHVEGGARLHIPAHAGLRLFVRGGLGAGIPIVSATAGLELGGSLGLEGAVDAGVHVDWMPTRGLVLDAAGEVYVEPRFRFDITGYVRVEADLLLTTIELYSQRWQLAAVEYGSGLRLGMRFPIHYEEGRPFEMSWNDVQFQIPDVNPREVLSGLIEQIA